MHKVFCEMMLSKTRRRKNVHTSSFCACESGSVTDVRLCVDTSSLAPCPDRRHLLWDERSGDALNDGTTNSLHL